MVFYKKKTFTICVGFVWIVTNRIFLIRKEDFNGSLKVIGIQNIFYISKLYQLYLQVNFVEKLPFMLNRRFTGYFLDFSNNIKWIIINSLKLV